MIFRKAVLLPCRRCRRHDSFRLRAVRCLWRVHRRSSQQSAIVAAVAVSDDDRPAVDPVNPLGGTGGLYYDFLKLGPVRLGGDVRGSILTTKRGAFVTSNAGGTRIYSVLGGVRAAIHTPIAPLKPYVQFSAGLGRSDYGLSRTPHRPARLSSTATSNTKVWPAWM